MLLPLLLGSPARADEAGSAGRLAARLRAALERGSAVELEEIGLQATGRDLSLALGSPDRKVVLGAIAAAPAARDAWALLAALADIAGRPDRPMASAAAGSAARIAAGLDHVMVRRHELTEHELAAPLAGWQAVAGAAHRWADVRVHALEVSAHLAAAMGAPAPGFSLAASAADPEPEVRRAAFELLLPPLADEARDVAARAVAGDADPLVALAAAQALCSGLGRGEAAAPVLAALGEQGRTRLAELVTEPDRPPAALLDAARCLAADAGAASVKALAFLDSKGPAVIRKEVRRLADAAAPKKTKTPPRRKRARK